MNEKIRELEKQAIDALRHKPFSMEQFREKFAELIVRECAELMPQDNLYNMVLKHFGVDQDNGEYSYK